MQSFGIQYCQVTTWQGEFIIKRKNGDSYWESAAISSIVDNQGDISFSLL